MHQANKTGAVFRLWRASSGSVVGSLMACGEEIKFRSRSAVRDCARRSRQLDRVWGLLEQLAHDRRRPAT